MQFFYLIVFSIKKLITKCFFQNLTKRLLLAHRLSQAGLPALRLPAMPQDTPPGLEDDAQPQLQFSKPPLPEGPAPNATKARNDNEPQLAFWQQLQGQRDPLRPASTRKPKASPARAAAVLSTSSSLGPARGSAAAVAAAKGVTPEAAAAASEARIAELEARVQELRTTLWRANSRLGSLQEKYIEESGFLAEDELEPAERESLQTIYDENKTSAGGFPIEMVMPALARALDWRLDCAPGKLCRQFVINRLQWSGLPLSFRELVRLYQFVRADPAEAVELPHLREEVVVLREKLRHSGEEVARLRSLVASESKARVEELATLLPQLQELAALRESYAAKAQEVAQMRGELDDARSARQRAEHGSSALEKMLLAAQAKAVKVEAELALTLRKLSSERTERSVEAMRKKHAAELEACRAGFAVEFERQQKEIEGLVQAMAQLS